MKTTGVFTYAQLRAQGMSRRLINKAVNEGSLDRVGHGWYANAQASPQVVTAINHRGLVGCLSGCKIHGLWTPPHDDLHVVYGRGQKPQASRGIKLHASQERRPAAAVWPIDACVDHVLHRHHTESALIVMESAINLNLLTREEVSELCMKRPGPGLRVLRYLDTAQSGSETRVRLFFLQRGVKVRTQVPIGTLGWVDLLVGNSLIVECDSAAHHSSASQQANDRRRDLAARMLGYDTIRLSFSQIWNSWEATQRDLSLTLAKRRHMNKPRPLVRS